MDGSYTGTGSGYWLFHHCNKLQEVTVDCDYVGPYAFESCYSLQDVTFTNRDTQFYFLEHDSCHPFNANGSSVMQLTVHGYLCSKASALVEKTKSEPGRNIKLTFSRIEGDTTEHTEQIVPAVAATCSSTGLTEGKICSVCGTVLVRQTVVASPKHTLKAVEAKEPTCVEEGCVAHWACTVCGATFSDAEGKTKTDPTIAKKAHTEVIDEAVAPTCTETGLTEGKHCSICNEVLVAQKQVPAIGHIVGAWTVTRQATCAEEGEEQGTCSACGNTETRAIPKIAHTEVVDSRVEPTCTETGLTEGKHCSACNKVLVEQKEIPALGHDMAKTEAVEPTYWDAGNNAYYTCSRCGKVFKDANGETETTVEDETLAVLPSIAHGTCGYNLITWVLTEDGTLTISGSGNMKDYSSSSVAPWYSNRTKILSVVVEPGVESVGNYAFYACLKLASVSLPGGVKSVGQSAFQDCAKLTAVEIPEGVTSIGYRAFYGCSGLTSVTIPEGVTSIGSSAFSGCRSLTSVTIPEGVTSIGSSAFDGCSSLTSVTIPDSVTSIGNSAFYGCSKLKHVYYGGSDLQWKEIEIGNDNSALTKAIIHYASTHAHNVEHVPGKAASCTETGNLEYWRCLACGEYFIDEELTQSTDEANVILSALGHTMTETEAKAATCTQDGNNRYFTCSTCGKVFKDEQGTQETTAQAEILPALGHTTKLVDTVAPTCTQPGNKAYYVCETCGRAFKDKQGTQATTVRAEAVPALGHTEVTDQRVEPTCTKTGLTEGTHCSVCDEVLTAQKEIPAKGHSEVIDEGTEPTCTKPGLTEGKHCSVCNEVLVAQKEIPANGHTEVIDEGVKPTCTKPGLTEGKHCSVCNEVLTAQKEIPANGHTEVIDERVEPTCTKAGLTEGKHCSACSEVLTAQEEIPALGHTEVTDQRVEPTCTKTGLTEGTHCSVCDEVLTAQKEIPAKGHSEVIDEGTEPTCTKPGLTEGKHCSVCNEVLTAQEEIPAKGHDVEKVEAKDATCTEDGNNDYYVCRVCGEAFRDEKCEQATTVEAETLSALGHEITKVEAAEPTWEAAGNIEYYICSRCEKLFKDALGTEETTLEEVTLPMISYVTEIILTRDGELVPETMEVDGRTSRTLSFAVMVQPAGAETKVEWSSSVPAVARVNQSGIVTLLTSGTTVITAAATDGSEVTAQVTLNVTAPDYAPRLGASTLTLNSVSCAGVSVDLVESYGNQILSVSVDDERFDAEYADSLLTLTSREAVARGTYRMTLEAVCDDGRTYSYPITVRVIQTLPRLTVRQSQRFNLFYRDSQAALTITGGEVESAELIGNSDFVLENEDGEWVIRYADPENAPAKPSTRATLSVSFAGYNIPVTKTLTIGTVNTAPKLKRNPTSSTLNTALNSDWSVETVLSGADGESLYAYTDTPGVDVALSGNVLTLTLTEAKNVSANVYVQDDNWTKPVKLTHRVTVTNRLPTLRAAAGTLKLNSWFPSETASTGMILSQGNVSLTDVELTPAAREGTAARAESDKLNVYYDADSGEIVAEIADSGIKNGTYSFACTGILESGTEISGGTVRVTVSNTLPRARLSAAMVRLNRQLAGEESIAVKVTLTGGDGYAIEGFEELPDCLDYADGILTATIPNADFTGGSYVLNAIVSRNGETATLPAGVILRVQVYDRAPSFRLTAKGKLDVLNPASEIVYTPRLTNAQGTVTDIRLKGADAELFAAEVVDGVVHLTMAKGCTYSTRTTYKVTPVLTFCGQEVTGSTLSIRVTQSTVKLAKLSNRTVYQSQTAPLVQVLSITSPATAEFGEITLNSRSTAALRNAVEAAGGIEVSGGIVRFPAKAFASLKPGRYTVILDVTPENAAADAKPIQARFTLTVQK